MLRITTALLVSTAILASCANPLMKAAEAIKADAISPRMVVYSTGAAVIGSGTSVDYGIIGSGSASSITLTIVNRGNSALCIDVDHIAFSWESGTAEGTFKMATPPSSTVPIGSSTTIVLSFESSISSAGIKRATVSIPTNDTQSPMFSFCVQATASPISLETSVVTTSITTTTATGGGNITDAGGLSITSRGICWSTSANPETTDSYKANSGTGTGSYSDLLTGLSPGTLYYARAYAISQAGTAYGPQVSFTTLPDAPAKPWKVSAVPYAEGSGKLEVSWAAVAGSDIYYDVYYNTASTQQGANVVSNLSATSCTLEGLNNYSSYYVWIVAKNVTGPSAASPTMASPVMVGVKVESITLSKSSATFLYGSSETIIATCSPPTATVTSVTWPTVGSSFATVSGGTITGGSATGSVTFTVTAADGQGASASFTATTKAYLQNDAGPAGGILFYDKGSYSDGWRYMEAAPVNVGAGHAWSPKAYYVNIPGAFGTGIGPGLDNSLAIENAFGSGTYLAKDCLDYSLNGYSDWFMPSDTEAANVIWYVLGASYSSLAYFVSSTQYGNGTGNGCRAYYCSSTSPGWTSITVTLSGSTIVTRPVRRF